MCITDNLCSNLSSMVRADTFPPCQRRIAAENPVCMRVPSILHLVYVTCLSKIETCNIGFDDREARFTFQCAYADGSLRHLQQGVSTCSKAPPLIAGLGLSTLVKGISLCIPACLHGAAWRYINYPRCHVPLSFAVYRSAKSAARLTRLLPRF